MALTRTQIDNVLEQLYLNPTSSVTLADGRSFTYADISKLIELRKVLLDNIAETNNATPNSVFLKVYPDLT